VSLYHLDCYDDGTAKDKAAPDESDDDR
jgi:hypothetical protein